jgi:phosphoenolpyruvate carboxykinase (ATP)
VAREHGLDGGPSRGGRILINATRALDAALSGELAGVELRTDPVFGFAVPVSVPRVPVGLLNPRLTWSDPTAYDAKAAELARMFRRNFERFDDVSPGVAAAGPPS